MTRYSYLLRATGYILLVLCVSALIACATGLKFDLEVANSVVSDQEHENMELMMAYGLFILGAVTSLFQFYCGFIGVRGEHGKLSFLAMGIILLILEIVYCVVSWLISVGLINMTIAALGIIVSVFYLVYGKKKDDEIRKDAEEDEG